MISLLQSLTPLDMHNLELEVGTGAIIKFRKLSFDGRNELKEKLHHTDSPFPSTTVKRHLNKQVWTSGQTEVCLSGCLTRMCIVFGPQTAL